MGAIVADRSNELLTSIYAEGQLIPAAPADQPGRLAAYLRHTSYLCLIASTMK